MKGHIRVCHRNEVYTCESCPKVFKQRISLEDHFIKIHNQDATEIYKCDFCDKSYIRIQGLKRHTRTNHSKENDMISL